MPYFSEICRVEISGEAGEGIITAGDMLMRTAAREGFHSIFVRSYTSNIRNGYTQSFVSISDRPIISPLGEADILFALSPAALSRSTVKPNRKALIFYDAFFYEEGIERDFSDRMGNCGFYLCPVPIRELVGDSNENIPLRSIIALGIAAEIMGLRREALVEVIEERIGRKGAERLRHNLTAVGAGREWARNNIDIKKYIILPSPACRVGRKGKIVVDGNQAIAFGALAAGCKFFASYPITPATSIGETIAGHIDSFGGFAYQAEDEIAAIGAAIGASFAGVKAMTATSGPGLSLMQEFIGYASMAELPVVVADVQRVGPSTGMPTKHSQADLFAAALGGHGEDQRIVLAPDSVEACFFTAIDAFNCAEKYQCPVIVLSDSTLGSATTVIDESSLQPYEVINREVITDNNSRLEDWKRYGLNKSGLNPVSVPGLSSFTYRATGIEHNEESVPADSPEVRSMQVSRRFSKLRNIESEFANSVEWDIDQDKGKPFDISICAWGLNAAITREAVAILRSEGIRIAALYPRLLFPVCVEAFNRWAKYSQVQVVVETNYNGQFCSLVKMATRAEPQSVTISRGEPFSPSEIVDKIKSIIGKR